MKALAANKKRHLVFVYVTQGYSAAKPLAVEYGISPKIISKYTRAIGIMGKPGREVKAKTKPKRQDRWRHAKARGEISI